MDIIGISLKIILVVLIFLLLILIKRQKAKTKKVCPECGSDNIAVDESENMTSGDNNKSNTLKVYYSCISCGNKWIEKL